MEIDHTFKYIILGDSGVGKTSLIKRYSKNVWDPNVEETIGVAFESLVCDIFNTKVRLHIWDTAGQERYRALTKMYYRETMGIICVFDMSSEKSFEALGKWMSDIRENCDNCVQIIILGNKSDLLESSYVIPKTKIENFCKANNVTYFQVSAKSGMGISRAIDHLNELVLKKVEEKSYPFYKSQRTKITIYQNELISLEEQSYCKC